MYYDEIAEGYNELYLEEQKEKLNEFLQRFELKQDMKLIDVGCGTGWTSELKVEWTGVEPSAKMIAQAPEHAKEEITHSKGENLGFFHDETFDVILSLTALQNYDDPEKGLNEMNRVCKKNGTILISFLKQTEKNLDKLIRKTFKVVEHWEQKKDLMYICHKLFKDSSDE